MSLADIGDARVIMELGAGDGRVTRRILAHKSPDTKLIIIEMDSRKVEILRREFSTQCEIYEMSAAHIDQIVGHDAIDVIISTLPLGSISPEGVDHILHAAQSVLRSGGRYIQYQYALQNLSDVRRYFSVDHIRFELRNFWPAFIYVTHKK